MTSLKSDFLRVLTERRYIHQCTNLEGLDALAAEKTPFGAYIGFDATAPSLHVGSLVQIMMLRKLQQAGHKPLVLMGGGTTKIGDPSFRDESRPLLDEARIAENIAGIKRVFAKFLTFGDGPTDAVMVDNDAWLSKLNYIEFLRDYGRHFSVNRMLSQDSVKIRLDREQNLSFLEFNYMILQAYDFVELTRRHGVRLQMGGSDQWGNIVQGVDLGRRVADVELFGLTSPLITSASGAKMGKTAKGAVWLNEDALSPYDYWQFWRNTEDGDVGRFLRLFTELPEAEVRRLEALEGAELNDAKKILATEATTLAHGSEAAAAAAETARRTFEEGVLDVSLPTITVNAATIGDGIPLANLMFSVGVSASNSEARRLIANNAVSFNEAKVADPVLTVTLADFPDGTAKLSTSKKKHFLIRVE